MIGRVRWKRAGAFGAIISSAVLLSGCVYLRLLQLKQQMGAFDKNFAVHTDVGVQIACLDPVLLSRDIRWFGLGPESVRKSGHSELWQVRWLKELPPGVTEKERYDIVVEMSFHHDKLTRVSIPERYFEAMPKTLLVDLLRSLGGAKVDRGDRSVEAELAAARPDLPGIQKILGRPTSHGHEGELEVMRYRYVPSVANTSKPAIFDITVYFNPETGDLLRWRGTTPVGAIGFNFQDPPKS